MFSNADAKQLGLLDERSGGHDGLFVAVAVLVAVLEDGGKLKPGAYACGLRKALASIGGSSNSPETQILERLIELFEAEAGDPVRL